MLVDMNFGSTLTVSPHHHNLEGSYHISAIAAEAINSMGGTTETLKMFGVVLDRLYNASWHVSDKENTSQPLSLVQSIILFELSLAESKNEGFARMEDIKKKYSIPDWTISKGAASLADEHYQKGGRALGYIKVERDFRNKVLMLTPKGQKICKMLFQK